MSDGRNMRYKEEKITDNNIQNIFKRRFLGEVTVFEIILSIFVILIHLCSEPLNTCENQVVLNLFFFLNKIISFAVPGFLFSSGLKQMYGANIKNAKYSEFIFRRITKIYLPYVFWVCIYYLFFVYYMNYFKFSGKDLIRYIAVGDLVAHFYFIIIIMQFYIIFPVIKKYVNLLNPIIGILLAFLITIFAVLFFSDFRYSDRNIFRYLVYFILGCYIGKNYDEALKILNKIKIALYIITAVFAYIYLSCLFWQFIGLGTFEHIELLKIFFCSFMTLSMFTFLSSEEKAKRFSKSSIIKTLGSATFYVYLMHCIFIFFVENELTKLGIDKTSSRFVIKLIFVTGLSFVSSIIYVKIKRKIKKIKR